MSRNTPPGPTSRPGRRLLWTTALAAALLGTVLVLPSGASRAGGLFALHDASVAALLESTPHTDPPGSTHRHDDPATKNSLSRAGEVGQDTQDPTTASAKRQHAAYVARQREAAEPRLTTTRVTAPRSARPGTRYAMANGCYVLRAAGRYVASAADGDGLTTAAKTRREALPFFFKATDLGTYLLYGTARDFVAAGSGDVRMADAPSTDAEWTVRKRGGGFSFHTADDRAIALGGGRRLVVADEAERFGLVRARGCTRYPEARIDIAGDPHAGVTPFQEVRGYVDAHTHGMAFEFLGGDAHCGRPWHTYGAPYALVDCPDHTATNGYGAALEAFLSGEPSHDPVGWPTFKDWPAPESLTHEGTYYRWLERSWRGGQRIFVNLLVENNQLCQLYPIKHNSCDDMDSVRLQAKDMYALQDYIDAQFGGPGKGFYRIVKSPFEARKVINAGKMAVIMGIETSVPFGCTMKVDVPACDTATIDRQLTEVHKMGVRQMELVNKFDNALSGVAGDAGETGVAVNNANFLETGSYWDMEHCEPADGQSHDKNQVAVPDISAGQQDALFGAVAALGLPNLAVPVYPPPDHCNSRGLTTLGEHTIKGLAERHMIFDPDHMSVKARESALDQVEAMKYSGVISSHSWATPDAYPRIYELGGFITPYAGDSTGFVEKWRTHLGWADPRFYWGIGYGADMNGLGAQGDPRGAGIRNPVSYPFTGINGITVDQQHAGKRVYDINVDGVAQYGLYPDWIEDLRQVAGADGSAIVDDMARGAEAYLQMWERAEGIAPDSCRNPALRQGLGSVRSALSRGMTTREVMTAVGQPYTRLGDRFTFCARTATDPEVPVRVGFDRHGRLTDVRTIG